MFTTSISQKKYSLSTTYKHQQRYWTGFLRIGQRLGHSFRIIHALVCHRAFPPCNAFFLNNQLRNVGETKTYLSYHPTIPHNHQHHCSVGTLDLEANIPSSSNIQWASNCVGMLICCITTGTERQPLPTQIFTLWHEKMPKWGFPRPPIFSNVALYFWHATVCTHLYFNPPIPPSIHHHLWKVFAVSWLSIVSSLEIKLFLFSATNHIGTSANQK